jgi:hypothetical protein
MSTHVRATNHYCTTSKLPQNTHTNTHARTQTHPQRLREESDEETKHCKSNKLQHTTSMQNAHHIIIIIPPESRATTSITQITITSCITQLKSKSSP